MDFPKLLMIDGFIKIDTLLISLSCSIDMLKLLYGFAKAVLCISHPLPRTAKLKFDQEGRYLVSEGGEEQ